MANSGYTAKKPIWAVKQGDGASVRWPHEYASNWLVDEGISETEVADDQNSAFGSIDAERLATTLIGDFEGSSVGDEIVDFASEYSVTYEA